MLLFLYIIPILAVLSSVFLYQHSGKREFLKFDLVHFFYGFVIAPLVFVWLKTFLFVLLKGDLSRTFSSSQLFIFDTAFSVLCLYLFGFVIIHSLTASFNRKMVRDPLYDLFAHSEFFHLLLSHLVIYGGALVVLTILASINVFFPLQLTATRTEFYLLGGTAVVTGIFAFISAWLFDPNQGGVNFMRVMKLLFGLCFIVHTAFYFTMQPAFAMSAGMFWWTFTFFTTLVICSLFAYKSERAHNLFEKWSIRFRFDNWGSKNNLE